MFLVAFLYICFTVNMFVEGSIMSCNGYPLLIAGLRICGAGLILLVAYAVQHKKIDYKELQQLTSYAAMKYIIVLYVLSVLAGAWSMQYIDPVKTCFIFVLSPFMTALMLYFWYGETLSYKKIAGLMIGFSAVVPIILASGSAQTNQIDWGFSMFAYLTFTCGVILFAYGWILHKNLSKSLTISSALSTAVSLTIGGVINLLLALMFYGSKINSIQLSPCFWWKICVFALLTAVSYHLYSVALQRYSITFVSFASFMQPAFGMLFALLFFGQSISLFSIAALVALGFGLYLFYQEELIVAKKNNDR